MTMTLDEAIAYFDGSAFKTGTRLLDAWSVIRANLSQPQPVTHGDRVTPEMIDQLSDSVELLKRVDAPRTARLQPQPVAQGEAVGGDAFIIKYEDTDEADEVFIGYGAREIAFKRYEQLSTAWSAHLFQRIHCNTDQSPMPSATPTIPTGHRVVPVAEVVIDPQSGHRQLVTYFENGALPEVGTKFYAAPDAGGV